MEPELPACAGHASKAQLQQEEVDKISYRTPPPPSPPAMLLAVYADHETLGLGNPPHLTSIARVAPINAHCCIFVLLPFLFLFFRRYMYMYVHCDKNI